MKEKKIRRPSRIAFCFVSFLLIIFMVLNVVITNVVSPYFGFIQNFLTEAPKSNEAKEATAASAEVTKTIEEEGIVLLKNNGSLPLKDEKINVFGNGAANFTFGGTGPGSGDTSANVSIYDGLKNAGFQVNEDLEQFTAEKSIAREDKGMVGNDFAINEIPVKDYSDELLKDAKEFSDTAVVVISRSGGEGDDCPMSMEDYGGDADKHYLELQNDEIEMLQMVEDNFKNVVVLLNSPNAMELGFLEDEAIDAALWVGLPGSVGCNAIGEVLSGVVNPSGRTTDIFAYEVESAPSYYNFGGYDYTNVKYANASMFAGTGTAATGDNPYHYVEYVEGIYVGYRYYETAAADGYINYDETVQYPFGYGLSYTDFSEEITDFKADGKTVSVDVKVTNTGDVAGKDVVELYYSAPYNKGGIEKSQVILGGFTKTDSLEPGKSQTVTVSWNYEDMASYDYSGIKADGGAYVLEAGEYQINLQKDSHNVIDSRKMKVDRDYIYNEANDGARSSDEIAATNQFDDVSFGDNLTYVSRADWEGTMPKERAVQSKEATKEQVAALENGTQFDIDDDVDDIVVKNHGLKLKDMKGLDYDDPKWDELMEQVSVKEMKLLIGNGGWETMPVKSVGKQFMTECDGPNGINNLMANKFSGVNGNNFTGQCVLGQTWNTSLATTMGESIGQECVEYNIAGLYGPAMNIHRSPFSGRNYEYYSEDGFLSGKMAAAEVIGIQSKGVNCYNKHFAVNDQETNRDAGGLVTWVNEQAMREIYLKGFEVAVKEGEAMGIMSSFNRIGTVPTAESYPLLTTVLRNEWGFKGCVITDCVMACTTEDVNQSLLAGNDLQLTVLGQLKILTDTPVQKQALRRATKNIFYMIVNGDSLNYISTSMPTIEKVLIVVDIIIAALFVLYYVKRHKKMTKWKASQKQKEEVEK